MIDLSQNITAIATGGDKVGTFLVYIGKASSGYGDVTLTEYLVDEGLIEVLDENGDPVLDLDNEGQKVVKTELQLIDDDGVSIGQFMGDANNHKYMFAVQAGKQDQEFFSAKIVFQIISQPLTALFI